MEINEKVSTSFRHYEDCYATLTESRFPPIVGDVTFNMQD